MADDEVNLNPDNNVISPVIATSLLGATSSSVNIGTANSDPPKRSAVKKTRVRRKKRPKEQTAKAPSIPNDCEEPMSTLDLQNEFDNLTIESDSNSDAAQLLNEMRISAVTSQVSGSVIRIKRQRFKNINTKFLKYLDEGCEITPNKICCNCNCHRKPVNNNVSDIRGVYKIDSDSPGVCNGSSSSSSQNSSPVVNGFNLQPEHASKTLQQFLSTRPSKKKKKKVAPKQVKQYPGCTWSLEEIGRGLESGQLFQGTIRINAKNVREAYVSSSKDDENDYLLPSVIDRNRALDGDVVAIKLKHHGEWTERLKTATVVQILEEVHPRTAVGFIQPMPNDSNFVTFIPRDLRIPRMKIPIRSCPQDFLRSSHRFENILYKGCIVEWTDTKFAKGQLLECLGFGGDLESETMAIVADHGLDSTPFKPNIEGLPIMTETIRDTELAYRKDLRKECIFTIDPMTARDLDDAVSCKELDNGNLEIGVHISDVSHYLEEMSELNKCVRKKATTIYMVNNVFHMLPEELCLHCSLLPGKDKLAFSVFWEMSRTGEILSHSFSRTIINSCVQLAYEHVQTIIESPHHTFADNEIPKIYGGFTQEDLRRTVNLLQPIAQNLRKKRFDNGCLRIDQTKLLFRIDAATGEPTDFFVAENKEAHRLIEEFMLLANITVATKISNSFPDKSFLRCHDPPKMRMLVELQKMLQNLDLDLDISSSKGVQTSLKTISESLDTAQMAVLNHLLAKPMMRARYFCSGDSKNNDFSHYALSVPIYTHFTSPIRRYADIMVHRLLSASLGYSDEPKWSRMDVSLTAEHCNKQKYNAKLAGDASCELYLAHYVATHQPFIREAVVTDIKHTSFEVLVYSTGSIIRLFTNALGDNIDCEVDQQDKELLIQFKGTGDLPPLNYRIKMFSLVTVALNRKPKSIKLEATLIRPLPNPVFGEQDLEED